MGLKRQAHLHNAPAQQDHAHRPNHAEDEVGQVVDNGEGVAASGRGMQHQSRTQCQRQHRDAVAAEGLRLLVCC